MIGVFRDFVPTNDVDKRALDIFVQINYPNIGKPLKNIYILIGWTFVKTSSIACSDKNVQAWTKFVQP